MENNKFDKRTMNIRTGLGLVGIQVDLKAAYLINKFMKAFLVKGKDLTLDEITDIKFNAEKFFDSDIVKPEMTLDDLKGVAIRCKTKKESDKFLKLVDKLGIEWDGESPCSKKRLKVWYHYGNETCYTIFGVRGFGWCNYNYFKSGEYTFKSAQWFLDNFTPKDKEE